MKKQLLFSIFFLVFASSFWAQSSNPKTCPCCKEEFRQFDFWIGTWNVTSNDKAAGQNTISIQQDSCVLKEEWVSATPGYTGTSYNFYNPSTKKWHQTWIDNQGSSLFLSGSLVGGQMILQDELQTNTKGEKIQNRITWTPNEDGTVRQLWEATKDGGETWNVLFDGNYIKN